MSVAICGGGSGLVVDVVSCRGQALCRDSSAMVSWYVFVHGGGGEDCGVLKVAE